MRRHGDITRFAGRSWTAVAGRAVLGMVGLGLFAAIPLSGCVNIRRDMSRSAKAWHPYDAGKVYKLRHDVFLMKVDSGLESKRLALVPPSDEPGVVGQYSAPKSIEAYEQNPAEASRRYHPHGYYDVEVEGVVRAGTTFVPHKVMKNSGWNLWSGHHTLNTLYGRITSGPFAGKKVDLTDVTGSRGTASEISRYVVMTD